MLDGQSLTQEHCFYSQSAMSPLLQGIKQQDDFCWVARMSSMDEEELSDVQVTCVSHTDLQGQESDPKYVTFILSHTPPTALYLHS